MGFSHIILSRRSTRAYEDKPVSDEVLKELLEAGTWAPSAVNLQPWYFVAIKSKKQMKKLVEIMGIVSQIGHYVEKYLVGNAVNAEDRLRALRLCENLALGTAAVGYRTESMHGAGSPQAQKVMITRQGNFEGKKGLAKRLAGIKE